MSYENVTSKQKNKELNMAQATDKQTEDALHEGAQKIKKEDLQKVLSKQKEIEEKFQPDGPLGGLLFDVELLISLIQDYDNGNYQEIPWKSLSGILTALLYVVSPIDLIPDFIPLIGTLDDAVVVAVCLKLVKNDLDAYALWKTKNA
jgi:uncharacterized membrane protein YkvA (DUF1232 family)